MVKFKYQPEPSPFYGQILRPVADVIMEANGNKVELSMYIDSGADITMIPLRFGQALGFKQTPSDKILEIRGVSGKGMPYIIKPAKIQIGPKHLKIRVAWALIEEVPLLLGRMDIFPKFKITFNKNKEYISFSPLS